MSSQDITLLLCPVISSCGVLVSASLKRINRFFLVKADEVTIKIFLERLCKAIISSLEISFF